MFIANMLLGMLFQVVMSLFILLTIKLKVFMHSKSLCKSDWPGTHRHLPSSAFQVLGLTVHDVTPDKLQPLPSIVDVFT